MLPGFLKFFMPKTAAKTAVADLSTKFEQARTLLQQGRTTPAQALCLEILDAQPEHVDTLIILGILAARQKDYKRAIQFFDRAIGFQPDGSAAYCNKGLALRELGDPNAALLEFRRALALNTKDAVAYYGIGSINAEYGEAEEALAAFEKAIAANAGFMEAYESRGSILEHLHRFEAAVANFDQAISRNPSHAPSYLYRGNALKGLHRLEESLASYDRAIEINPDYAEALSNRGVVLYDLGRIETALDSYDRAIAIKPGYVEAYFNRGSLLRIAKKYEAAIADFDIVTKLSPDIKFLTGARLEAKMQACDWSDFDTSAAQLATGIERGESRSHPFVFLTVSDSARLQRKAAEIWVREMCPADATLGPLLEWPRREKIRLGYFSGDYREHPTSRLLAELIETHDRSRFEVVAFSFGEDTRDDARKRLELAFDRFVDVHSWSNADIASLARSMQVDIAIDLCGYIHGSRPQIFAMRAAPLQVNYLGYPGTMGAPYMDYVIADRVLVPPGSDCHFVEKLICLPDSYQVNDTKRSVSEVAPTRDELGLPQQGLVFCCFNNNYKILPGTFGLWMQILKRVPNSVLWLLQDNVSAANALRERALAAGVTPGRLVFAKRLAPADHLARHRRADLFLDTLPYNAHTTASDALWTNLPVLTCPGDSFASRVAASLLTALEMTELIASSREHYVQLAVELGTNPSRLSEIRKKLECHRLTRPLFDSRRYAANLEMAFTTINERYRAGLPPDHVHVTPSADRYFSP